MSLKISFSKQLDYAWLRAKLGKSSALPRAVNLHWSKHRNAVVHWVSEKKVPRTCRCMQKFGHPCTKDVYTLFSLGVIFEEMVLFSIHTEISLWSKYSQWRSLTWPTSPNEPIKDWGDIKFRVLTTGRVFLHTTVYAVMWCDAACSII